MRSTLLLATLALSILAIPTALPVNEDTDTNTIGDSSSLNPRPRHVQAEDTLQEIESDNEPRSAEPFTRNHDSYKREAEPFTRNHDSYKRDAQNEYDAEGNGLEIRAYIRGDTKRYCLNENDEETKASGYVKGQTKRDCGNDDEDAKEVKEAKAPGYTRGQTKRDNTRDQINKARSETEPDSAQGPNKDGKLFRANGKFVHSSTPLDS